MSGTVREFRRTGVVTEQLLERLCRALPHMGADSRLAVYAACGTPWPTRDKLAHHRELRTVVDLVFDARGRRRCARPARCRRSREVRTPRDTVRRLAHDE